MNRQMDIDQLIHLLTHLSISQSIIYSTHTTWVHAHRTQKQ